MSNNINLNQNKNKENINEKLMNYHPKDKIDEKIIFDYNFNQNQKMSDIKKIGNNDIIENKDNSLSKSLSEINSNNESDENKKNISIINTILESREILNFPISKKKIVEINNLSQRLKVDENENEQNNRIIVQELRSKYFPVKKVNNLFRSQYTVSKDKIQISNKNFNFKNTSANKEINNKIESNRKYIKPQIILDDNYEIKINYYDNPNNNLYKDKINNHNKSLYIKDDKNLYTNLLKENNNIDKIKNISKDDILSLSNEKEKIIILLEKNRELMEIIQKMEEKYKLLKEQYIKLYKKTNNIETFNSNNENNNLKKLLINENKNYEKKLENYEKIFSSLINYINDINNIFNLKNINFYEIKNFFKTYDYQNKNENNDNLLNSINNILNDNKKKIMKINKNKNDNNKNDDKILKKIRSFSKKERNEEKPKKMLLTRHINKIKKNKFNDKLKK